MNAIKTTAKAENKREGTNKGFGVAVLKSKQRTRKEVSDKLTISSKKMR